MNNSQRISEEIEERMLNFSINVIELCRNVPKTVENEIIKRQLISSSSSVGANYIEANNAASKLDFRSKIFTAKKEAAETRYWLRMLNQANPQIEVRDLLDECSQFLFILQKIVSSLKAAKLRA